MDKKILTEMIKSISKTKVFEQIGGMGKFKGGATDLQDMSSPNRPVGKSSKEQHHVEEEAIHQRSTLGGTYAKRRVNVHKSRLKPSQRTWQRGGTQSMRGGKRYTLEQEVDLGATDTKKEKETVSVNPVQNELKGPTK